MDKFRPKGLLIVIIIIGSIFFVVPTIYKIYNNYIHRNYIETTANIF